MQQHQEQPLTFDARIDCPDCGESAELRASRKKGKAVLECPGCGIVESGVIPYGEGLVVGEQND
jgi:uncharacterized Zn finger protein